MRAGHQPGDQVVDDWDHDQGEQGGGEQAADDGDRHGGANLSTLTSPEFADEGDSTEPAGQGQEPQGCGQCGHICV